MQDNNPIDDAGFQELLKTHNVQSPTNVDPWADMGLSTTPKEPTLAEKLSGRVQKVKDQVQNVHDTSADTSISPTQRFVGGQAEAAATPLVALGEAGGAIGDIVGAGIDKLSNARKDAPKSAFQEAIDKGTETIKNDKNQPATPFQTGIDASTQKIQAQLESLKTSHPELYDRLTQTVGLTNIAGLEAVPSISGGIKTAAKGIGKEDTLNVAKNVTKDDSFISNLITPELNQTKTAQAIATGKVKEAGMTGSRDISETVPFFKEIKTAVSEVPGVSSKNTVLENVNAVHDHIGTVAEDLLTGLKNSTKEKTMGALQDAPAKFTEYMKGVKATIAENPTLVGDAEKTATKILNKFQSFVKEQGVTPEGIIKARQKLDTWMSTQKGPNIFDPKTEGAVSTALRSIRQGGNDFLKQFAPDVKVEELLAKQTALYDAIENMAPKAAKEGANSLQRFVKAHPRLVEAAKYGAGLGVGAGTVGVITK